MSTTDAAEVRAREIVLKEGFHAPAGLSLTVRAIDGQAPGQNEVEGDKQVRGTGHEYQLSTSRYWQYNGHIPKAVKEWNIYGSSRLGIALPEADSKLNPKFTEQIGLRRYELTNHLDNVLATISDKHQGDYARFLSGSDNYPFGLSMANTKRKYQ